jgi:hypothetical protein
MGTNPQSNEKLEEKVGREERGLEIPDRVGI